MPLRRIRAIASRVLRQGTAVMAASASPDRERPAKTPLEWKESLRLFFAQRAESVSAVPSLEDLCYVSGRDPRLWSQPEFAEELVRSILEQAGATPSASVLEVGCASGFIARLIAPRVARYTGVDIAEDTLRVAERLGLTNATFLPSDGGALRFGDDTFDAVLCYDVFTNLPCFSEGEGLIREMLRVVRPGGRVLVGSVPDAGRRREFEARTATVSRELDARFGPLKARPEAANRNVRGIEPGIVCYYFSRADFIALGDKLGVKTELLDIHQSNPYFGFRFNAVFRKAGI